VISLPVLFGRFLVFGVAGWTVEALYEAYYKKPPRYSAILGGDKTQIPFLPIYGFGGALIGFMAPALSGVGWLGRAAVYGTALTGVELIGCQIDRTNGFCQWDYGNQGCDANGKPKPMSLLGCVDLKHTAAWAALGLAAEKAMTL